ncbi:C-signal [Parasteatoda tepidariorum]|uniref:C-signal n=1 Tax=Parasteatoda tepidariorum TaxID=114398 RepID=UPI001C7181A9|nr:C-factor-like [Parasteatoda tepidariorum]
MKFKNIFITGANRGIGYEFARQFVSSSDPPQVIFATYRSANSLQELKDLQEASKKTKVVLIKMDVTDPEEIEVARQIVETNVGEEGLDLLINNAGICEVTPYDGITVESLEKHFKTNAVAPLLITKALTPLLEKAAVQQNGYKAAVLNISAALGSMGLTGTIPFEVNVSTYKISKAAFNMAMRVSSLPLKEKGILIVIMCPGWVKTDMGNRDMAELTPEESISAMIKTIESVTEKDHGTFVDRFGKTIPF